MTREGLRCVVAGLAMATGWGAPAHAGAFFLSDQSTKATGRAYSGEAAEQGAQQLFFNPAAIGGITGLQSYFGLTAVLPYADAVNRGTTVSRPGGATVAVGGEQVSRNPVNKGFVPNGGFAIPLPGNFAFGFTMSSPYSFTTNYASNSWARYSADETRLRTFDFQPTIAWSPSPSISIGAAPNVEFVRATFRNYLPDPVSATLPDARQDLRGSGVDVGYTFGFQFHNDRVDIGAAYHSPITHHLRGTLTVGTFSSADPLAALLNQQQKGARATFTTPWSVALGGRYHATQQLTLNAQVTRFGWSRFDQIALSDLGPLIADQAVPQNYRDTFAYSVGFDYDLSQKLTLRGGVARDLSPVVDGFRDPRVPDGNRWDFASGLTYKINSLFALDAAAAYAKIKSNPIDQQSVLFDGTILTGASSNLAGELTHAHALLFSIGGHMTL